MPAQPSPQKPSPRPPPSPPTPNPSEIKIHQPGARIAGRYEVTSRPLMGGMGLVYLCYDHQADRPVALKTFRPEYLQDREARDRFLREGSIWVSLGKHPYIVRAYGVERIGDGSEIYLVLELVAKEEGRHDASLRSWLLPGETLSDVQTSLFAVQIVRALKHAGTIIPGFVHRDLKPENVLVGADRLISAGINRIRVTDFGLASVLATLSPKRQVIDEALQNSESHLRRTQLTRGIVGTPLYMAPEQWKGERVSIQTDMYALGCIVYEMVLGRTAVEGESVGELMKAHCEGEVCRSLGNGHSPLWNLLRGCTAVKPKDRFQDWDDVEKTLKEIYYARTFGDKFVLEEKEETIDRADRVALGWAQNAIGYSYLDIGKPEAAIRYFKRAQEVGAMEGSRLLEAAGLGYQGLAFEAFGDFHHALKSYTAALTIPDVIGSPMGNMILGNVGGAWVKLGEPRQALKYIEEALTTARKIGDRQAEGNAIGNLGAAYASLGETQKAIGHYEMALAIAREVGDRRIEATALGNLGNAFAKMGDVRKAIEYLEKTLEIALKISDRHMEAKTLSSLAFTYDTSGEMARGIENYERSLIVFRAVGDRYEEVKTLINLGRAYRALGDPQRAIINFEQALKIAREIGDRKEEGVALSCIAYAYLHLDNERQAIRFYEQALVIKRDLGETDALAPSVFNLARAYAHQGEIGRALPLAEEASRLFAQMGKEGYVRQAQQLIAEIKGDIPANAEFEVPPSVSEILNEFAPIIQVIVAATKGDQEMRKAVEHEFDTLRRSGLLIVDPIKRIWMGERNEDKLTASADKFGAIIIREILKRLNE